MNSEGATQFIHSGEHFPEDLVKFQSAMIFGAPRESISLCQSSLLFGGKRCEICHARLNDGISIFGNAISFTCGHSFCFACYSEEDEILDEFICSICANNKIKGSMLPLDFPDHMYVVKLTNIAWDTSEADVRRYLCKYEIAEHGIHIPIDRITGKTKNFALVELKEKPNLHEGGMKKDALKSRTVDIQESSYQEIFTTHFPKFDEKQNIFLTREEINSIVQICRNFKLHFSRKCAERPFEHVISILRFIPWIKLGQMARDHLFEMIKLSGEALKGHLEKQYTTLSPKMLDDLIKAGAEFPIFTEKQSSILLALKSMDKADVRIPSILEAKKQQRSEEKRVMDEKIKELELKITLLESELKRV